MEFTNLITAFYPGLYTPFQPPIQSSLSAGLQEMPHFRFSIQNIIDGKSKREEDIIFHVEMNRGQSDHFNRGWEEKNKDFMLLSYLLRSGWSNLGQDKLTSFCCKLYYNSSVYCPLKIVYPE